MKYLIMFLGFVISLGLQAQTEAIPEIKWPREVETKSGMVTYYQPQIDSYVSNILEGRSAISYKPNDGGDVVFGAFWFKSFLQTDKEARTGVMNNIEVLKLQFPGMEEGTREEDWSRNIEKALENMNIVLSLDQLVATLGEADNVQTSSANLNNNPPIIYFRDKPTILISVDGDPIWKELKDQQLKYVENSPFFIAQDLKSGAYYINGGGTWYTTSTPPDDWKITKNVASNIKKFAEANAPKSTAAVKSAKSKSTVTPDLLVVYKPSELIATNGKPEYKTIQGTSLLFVENTENDIIMDVNTQMHYVLLAGRWYKSKTLEDGSWVFEDPRDLPEDFSKIPEDSDIASVRVSVPDTDEARDALLEQTIPQTAEVVRSEAKLEVHFDGAPQFEDITGSGVSYSVNSDISVMKIGQKFYAVDNGIWFISNYPTGPWEVSDHRPDEVDNIPPSAPVYNTKYVYVYNSTPEVVYVGYLPGYMNSYVYNGVVVYGTGYYYPYWYGSVYYPRPMTYGYHVHYNPYTGWGFSAGYSYGWIGWGYHSYYRPYWGPCGYHAGYRNGYYNGYNRGYYHGYKQGAADGYVNSSRNAYRNQTTGVRNTTMREQVSSGRDVSRVSTRPNNIYTDKSGNVYERTKAGDWNQRSKAIELRDGMQRDVPSRTNDLRPEDVRREEIKRDRPEDIRDKDVKREDIQRDTRQPATRQPVQKQDTQVPVRPQTPAERQDQVRPDKIGRAHV